VNEVKARIKMASPALDIFQVEDSGVLWIGSEIAARAPGKYLFFDQKTGTKLVIEPHRALAAPCISPALRDNARTKGGADRLRLALSAHRHSRRTLGEENKSPRMVA
jgi:hypothetical protein